MRTLLIAAAIACAMVSCRHASGPAPVLAWYDVPYDGIADDPKRRLDVYAPSEGGPRPVLIWVHGGGWTKGDKSAVDRKPRVFTERGFVFVSVNYRLVPDVTVDDQARDVARAVSTVRRHCADWKGDPERLFLMGHSAGAHLAALVCTDGGYLGGEGMALSDVRGCVAMDVAAYDIPGRFKRSGEGVRATLGGIFGKTSGEQARVSPVTHVKRGAGHPPFLVFHIDVDPQKGQSELFVRRLRSAGVAARIHAAKGRGHKDLNEKVGAPGDEPTKAVFDFLSGR